MSEQPEEQIQELSYDETEELIGRLAHKLKDEKFDIWLLISRGGAPLGVMLAHCLNFFELTYFSVRWYDENDRKMEQPQVLQFPDEALLRGKRVLIIDEVWHTGDTLTLAKKKVYRAGGIPFVATLHFKNKKSTNEGEPDFYVEKTDVWNKYFWETIRRRVM
ncbi:MAG: phosphoribosyltransferase family protein [bacterium]